MSTVTINGKTYIGNNVMVCNGKVIVDGKPYEGNDKEIYITVTGDVSILKVDSCNQINITGNVNDLKNGSGDITVGGAVDSVTSGSGDIGIKGNAGTVQTGSGDVKVAGSVDSARTGSGNIYRN